MQVEFFYGTLNKIFHQLPDLCRFKELTSPKTGAESLLKIRIRIRNSKNSVHNVSAS